MNETDEIIETEDDIFYIITCYINPDYADKYPHRDVAYPSYLANFDMDIEKPFMIQAGIYDAIKFEETLSPTLFMRKAEEILGDEWEFELSSVSKNIFGRGVARFVYTW